MAGFVRLLFTRDALPDGFAGTAIDGQHDEAIPIARPDAAARRV
jgi:hypothetical protein